MPNNQNIKQPITLIASGRSGTTLLWNIFNRHPDVFGLGETEEIIHGVWYAMQRKLPWSNIQSHPKTPEGYDDLTSEVIRNIFLNHYYSEAPYWFHKPIGVPSVEFMSKNEDEFINTYWKVLKKSFPDSINFTILRNPLDVAVSSHKFGKWDYEIIVKRLIKMTNILLSEEANIQFAVTFEKLVQKQETEVRDIFEKVNLPYAPNVLKAFEKLHAPNLGTPNDQIDELKSNRQKSGFSHKEKWEQILKTKDVDILISKYQELFDKYNLEWTYPI